MNLRWTWAVALVLCLALLCAGWYWLSKPRRALQKVLAAVSSVELGRTKLETFEGVLKSQGLNPEKATVCQRSDCTYAFSTRNEAQTFLHSAPPSELVVNVSFSQNLATGIVVDSGNRGETGDRRDVHYWETTGKPLGNRGQTGRSLLVEAEESLIRICRFGRAASFLRGQDALQRFLQTLEEFRAAEGTTGMRTLPNYFGIGVRSAFRPAPFVIRFCVPNLATVLGDSPICHRFLLWYSRR